MRREPFFADEYFSDILKPARYAMKVQVPEPSIKPFVPFNMGSVPKYAKMASVLGMNSGVLAALNESAIDMMEEGQDPGLVSLYRKFLMAAYMKYSEVRGRVDDVYKEHDSNIESARVRHEKDARESHERLRNSEKHQKNCRELVRVRWNKLRKGIAKILEQDADTNHMHEQEAYLMNLLADHGILKKDGSRVMKFYWDRFDDLPVEDIYDIISSLNYRFNFS